MAENKTRELLDAGARIRLIAPLVTQQLSAWADARKLRWEARNYQHGDLCGVFLVVSVADRVTNARAFAEAEAQHVFCNAVDDIAHCSCYASAVVRRGTLQIAISTAGNSPALAQRLRKELELQFGEEYEPWVQQLGEVRSRMLEEKSIGSETRREFLHEQASAAALEVFRASRRRRDDSQSSAGNSGGA